MMRNLWFFAVAVMVACSASNADAVQATYTSLPLAVPDSRAIDLPPAAAAENAFLAALSTHGIENFDTYADAAYGFTATQALNFVGTSVTGTAGFSGMFKLPVLPSPVSVPAVL